MPSGLLSVSLFLWMFAHWFLAPRAAASAPMELDPTDADAGGSENNCDTAQTRSGAF